MIERNLQYVTVRKYGSAFLEAFGMLPLTYFGCVGDNQTDNYANLQVAIDESNKRGLCFIFVPNGTYLYRGTLINDNQIKFIGNPNYAKIYNPDTGNEVTIYQIGTQAPWFKGERTLDYSDIQSKSFAFAYKIPVKRPTELLIYFKATNVIIYATDGLVIANGAPYYVNGAFVGNPVFFDVGGLIKIGNISFGENEFYLTFHATEDPPISMHGAIEWKVR